MKAGDVRTSRKLGVEFFGLDMDIAFSTHKIFPWNPDTICHSTDFHEQRFKAENNT
jgi:hypothetical protein